MNSVMNYTIALFSSPVFIALLTGGLVFFFVFLVVVPQLKSMRETMAVFQSQVINELKDVRQSQSAKIDAVQNYVGQQQPGLNKRIEDAFDRINDSIKNVHKEIGAFDNVVDGIETIKRFMGNGKNLGIWGESQLAAILENLIPKTLYEENKCCNPDSGERVEFAIRIPSGTTDMEECRWLPIDAKFPQLKFEELIAARDAGDKEKSLKAKKELVSFIKTQAKAIKLKYIKPPFTTDFAILFLPTESLYAEVLRQPGLFEELLNEYQVHLTGPTTLAALLTSLQVGFRTWTWQKKSSEVWGILHAAKQETMELESLLKKALKNYESCQSEMESARKKSQALVKILKEAETQAPAIETAELFARAA